MCSAYSTIFILKKENVQRVHISVWPVTGLLSKISVKWPNLMHCFQWMVAGPRGQCGQTAQWPVVRAHRCEPTPASTPRHVIMGLTAVGRREKHRTVTVLPAWVCSEYHHHEHVHSFILSYLKYLSITKIKIIISSYDILIHTVWTVCIIRKKNVSKLGLWS